MKSSSIQQEPDSKAKVATANNSRDISTLRVAQAELSSGDTTGKVYMRLSPGSVAFLKDRSDVKQKVSAQIRQAVLSESLDTKSQT